MNRFDSASWGLTLAASKELEGVLIVVVLRPLKAPYPFQYSQMMHSSRTKQITLKNLSQEETKELMCVLLKARDVPEQVVLEIQKRGQGNPFLTSEIVSALQESGALQVTKTGECIMTSEIENCLSSVPSSLGGLLTGKIDRLTPENQVILKCASIIGQTFSVKMLRQILPAETDQKNLKRALRQIESANLIVLETPDPNLSYSFANTLIRDVVYGLMLFSQRRPLHSKTAEIYEASLSIGIV